jgi:hypothetical protein
MRSVTAAGSESAKRTVEPRRTAVRAVEPRAQGRTCLGAGGVERAELERRLSALR